MKKNVFVKGIALIVMIVMIAAVALTACADKDAQKANEELSAQLEQLKADLAGVKEQADKVPGLNDTITNLNGQVSDLTNDLKDANDTITDLNGKLEAADGTIKDLNNQITELEGKVENGSENNDLNKDPAGGNLDNENWTNAEKYIYDALVKLENERQYVLDNERDYFYCIEVFDPAELVIYNESYLAILRAETPAAAEAGVQSYIDRVDAIEEVDVTYAKAIEELKTLLADLETVTTTATWEEINAAKNTFWAIVSLMDHIDMMEAKLGNVWADPSAEYATIKSEFKYSQRNAYDNSFDHIATSIRKYLDIIQAELTYELKENVGGGKNLVSIYTDNVLNSFDTYRWSNYVMNNNFGTYRMMEQIILDCATENEDLGNESFEYIYDMYEIYILNRVYTLTEAQYDSAIAEIVADYNDVVANFRITVDTKSAITALIAKAELWADKYDICLQSDNEYDFVWINQYIMNDIDGIYFDMQDIYALEDNFNETLAVITERFANFANLVKEFYINNNFQVYYYNGAELREISDAWAEACKVAGLDTTTNPDYIDELLNVNGDFSVSANNGLNIGKYYTDWQTMYNDYLDLIDEIEALEEDTFALYNKTNFKSYTGTGVTSDMYLDRVWFMNLVPYDTAKLDGDNFVSVYSIEYFTKTSGSKTTKFEEAYNKMIEEIEDEIDGLEAQVDAILNTWNQPTSALNPETNSALNRNLDIIAKIALWNQILDDEANVVEFEAIVAAVVADYPALEQKINIAAKVELDKIMRGEQTWNVLDNLENVLKQAIL